MQFPTERHALDLEYKGQSYRLFARELGYIHFQELCSAKYPDPRGVGVLNAVVLACMETEDGKPAFTAQTWRDAPKAIAEPVSTAAMKAQGINPEEDDKPEAATEGNV